MKVNQNFSVVNLTQQDIPVITEDIKTRYQWVPVGVIGPDDFFQNVTDAYNNSTTNAACIEGIADLVYGKGLYTLEQRNCMTNRKLKTTIIAQIGVTIKHKEIRRRFLLMVHQLKRWKSYGLRITHQANTIIHYLIGFLHYNSHLLKLNYQTYILTTLRMVSYH